MGNKERFKKWYQLHREKHLARQRERHQVQKDHINARRRRRYAERKAQEAREAMRPEVECETIQLKAGLYAVPDGEQTLYIWLWTRAELAQALGMSEDAVKRWDIAGVLPDALYRDKHQAKLYTFDQVNVTVEVFETCYAGRRRIPRRASRFSRWLHALWKEMPKGIWEDFDDKFDS